VLGRRIDYLSPTLYVTDILLCFMLLFWVMDIIRDKRHEIRITGKTLLMTILVIVFAVVNILFSRNSFVAQYSWVKVIEFVLLGFYVIKTKPFASHISHLLSLAVFYSSILAIWQFLLQHSVGGIWWWLGERTFTATTGGIAQISWCHGVSSGCQLLLRAYGTFPHPNVLGGFLAVTLPLIGNDLIRPIRPILPINEKIIRIFQWTAFLLGGVALIVTFSRTAWIVGVAGLCLMEFIRRKKKNTLWIPVLVLITIATVLFFIPLSPTDESIVVREQLGLSAIHIWQSSPILGVGLGNFLVALPRFLPSRTIYFLQPVHNIYLLLLSEVGISGILLICWFVYIEIRDKRKEIRKNQARFHISYLIPLISLCLIGLVDHYPLTLQQGQLMLTLFISLSIASNG